MLNEKALSRISFWTEVNSYTSANVQATYRNKTVKFPEYLLSEEAAIESLRNIVGQLKVIESKFGGECGLTDNNIRRGEEIYFGTVNGIKHAIRKADADSILNK